MFPTMGYRRSLRIDMTWEYLAGFTDADGYIVAQPGRHYIAAARIGWSQSRSARWQLEAIQTFLTAQFVESSLTDEKDRHGTLSSRLRVSQEMSARRVLCQMLPHLVLKRERALNVLDLLDERREARIRQGRRERVDQAVAP